MRHRLERSDRPAELFTRRGVLQRQVERPLGRSDGAAKVLSGVTTVEEVMMVTTADKE